MLFDHCRKTKKKLKTKKTKNKPKIFHSKQLKKASVQNCHKMLFLFFLNKDIVCSCPDIYYAFYQIWNFNNSKMFFCTYHIIKIAQYLVLAEAVIVSDSFTDKQLASHKTAINISLINLSCPFCLNLLISPSCNYQRSIISRFF